MQQEKLWIEKNKCGGDNNAGNLSEINVHSESTYEYFDSVTSGILYFTIWE